MAAPLVCRVVVVGWLAVAVVSEVAGAGAQAADTSPVACTVAPRTVVEIVAVVGTPEPRPASSPRPIDEEGPGGTPRPVRVELPPGEPVDQAAIAAVSETVRMFLACGNAGDGLALMALVSDDFLRQSFAGAPLTEASIVAYAATPQPRPADHQRRLVAVREARLMADGRVGVLVDTTTDANPHAIDTDFVALVEIEGRFLIDHYVAGLGAWFGPNLATPVP